jgi:hypothetical protein
MLTCLPDSGVSVEHPMPDAEPRPQRRRYGMGYPATAARLIAEAGHEQYSSSVQHRTL